MASSIFGTPTHVVIRCCTKCILAYSFCSADGHVLQDPTMPLHSLTNNSPANRHRRILPASALTLALVAALPVAASAFGKNKVPYQDLDWQYRSTPYYNIYAHRAQGDIPEITCHIVRNAYHSLHEQFEFTHRKPVPIIVYGSGALFEQTNVLPDLIPEGVGGFTEMFKNRVVVPWTGSYADFRHVVHHEMVHAFQFGILYDRFGGSILKNAGFNIPLWFAEGMAEYLSSGWDREADMFLIDRMVHGDVGLPGPELNGYMAYKGGQSFFHFLESTRGDSLFAQFLTNFKKLRTVEDAMERTYGHSLEDLGKEWKRQLKKVYWPEIALRDDPPKASLRVTGKKFKRARYNLRPRISPDGSKVAFFSDLRDFTRIYVTSPDGSDVLATVSQQGYGGYFESFSPFRSGLCWAPDNARLAFVTRRGGRDEIRVVDVVADTHVTTVRFDTLHTVTSPSWSPDGDQVVFAAASGHMSDLYTYRFSDSTLHRLTHDVAFESGPRFSPDGKRVAYSVQDTSFAWSRHPSRESSARTSLAVLDLESGTASVLAATDWDDDQPCFVGNDSVVFVSNRNGIRNLYLGSLDGIDSARALTNVVGFCSSPDWAQDTSLLVYTLFQKGSWQVVRMPSPRKQLADSALISTRWVQHLADTTIPFFTPPAPEDTTETDTTTTDTLATDADSVSTGTISVADSVSSDSTTTAGSISTDSTGAADSTASPGDTLAALTDSVWTGPMQYRLKFSPDIITVGLGVSSLYGYAGQVLVALSDLLGDHRIVVAGDLQGRIDEYMHLYGSYANTKRRLAFGVSAFYGRHYTLLSSLYHDVTAGGDVLLRWPFSLRSRLSLSCYYSHVERTPTSGTGSTQGFDVLLPRLAFSFDNVVWGLTGPVNGSRANVSTTVAPPIESLDATFASAEGDLRRYFHFARKFVLALRASAGASLSFDDDRRSRRYILGGSPYWFNYEVNHEGYEENIDDLFYSDIVVPFRGWHYYDLSGERYAVANVEFRFPFIREVAIAWPLPLRLQYVNGAVFVDVGNAWDPEDQLDNFPLPRDLYGGFGFGLRANLGVFVLRYDRAWRTDWQTFANRPVNYWSLGGDF